MIVVVGNAYCITLALQQRLIDDFIDTQTDFTTGSMSYFLFYFILFSKIHYDI